MQRKVLLTVFFKKTSIKNERLFKEKTIFYNIFWDGQAQQVNRASRSSEIKFRELHKPGKNWRSFLFFWKHKWGKKHIVYCTYKIYHSNLFTPLMSELSLLISRCDEVHTKVWWPWSKMHANFACRMYAGSQFFYQTWKIQPCNIGNSFKIL